MKKVKYVFIAVAITAVFIGFASAQQNKEDVLQSVIAHTDTLFASVMNKIPNQDLVFDNPVPENAQEKLQRVWLYDITKKCTVGDDVVTAYPKVYTLFNSGENRRILKVYSYKNLKGDYHRVEVYLTGGDWMQYALVYVITDAGNDKKTVHAYFVDELSSPDHADGAIAPQINPLDPKKLVEFISTGFLEADGNVKRTFNEIASVSVAE